MNKRTVLPWLISFSGLLLSCTPNQARSGYIQYKEPTAGTYDPNRKFNEEEPIDLANLGLNEDLDALIPPNVSPFRDRKDGCIDPFAGKTPDQLSHGSTNTTERYDHYSCDYLDFLFDDDKYVYVCFPAWHADISDIGQGRYPCFYDDTLPEYESCCMRGGVFIDAVYSHGAWSYLANFNYGAGTTKPPFYAFGGYGLTLLWAIQQCNPGDFPYTVYMDIECIYFMSKDTVFPNDYIESFNRCETMHLLYE